MRGTGRGTGKGRGGETGERKKGGRKKGQRVLPGPTRGDRRRNKNKKRTLCARPTAAHRLDQTNKSLSPLWSLAYLRPATDSVSRQVPCLFLAFPRKKILCVPAYVLTAEEKFQKREGVREPIREREGREEEKRETERETKAENLNKSRATS